MFNFTIHYRSGKHNGKADALTRKPQQMLEPELKRFESSMETVTSTLGMALESTIIPEQLKSQILETMTGVHMEQIRCLQQCSLSQVSPKRTWQRADAQIGRVWSFWDIGKMPTTRQLMKVDKPTRKLLREWKRQF